MKIWTLASYAVFLASIGAAQESGETKLASDPFANLEDIPVVADYSVEVDRTRGSFVLDATDGKYSEGAHFAKWDWKLEAPRSGNYQVGLIYQSTYPSLGVQVRIADAAVLKTRVPSADSVSRRNAFVLGKHYVPEAREYPVTVLTSDLSNTPSCRVKALEFSPVPESEVPDQSVDGTILLEAKTATTYSENMRYDPGQGNNCLSFWTSEEDWAEWIFDLKKPGKFELSVFYRCENGNGGSAVKLLVNEHVLDLTTEETEETEETGGAWKELKLGKVKLDIAGENKIAILPETKKAKAVLEVQKLVLTPVR